jgi:hypothetical protein
MSRTLKQTEDLIKSIELNIIHYNQYYNRKRSNYELFIMKEAIVRICQTFYNDTIPNIYVMWLSADAAFSFLKRKNRFKDSIIDNLEEELTKDIHIFNQLV